MSSLFNLHNALIILQYKLHVTKRTKTNNNINGQCCRKNTAVFTARIIGGFLHPATSELVFTYYVLIKGASNFKEIEKYHD